VELERSKTLRNRSAERMRLLLVLFERGDELLVEPASISEYGLSEDRSKPSLEMSVLLSSNFAPFSFSTGSMNHLLLYSFELNESYTHHHIDPNFIGNISPLSSSQSYLLTAWAIFINFYKSEAVYSPDRRLIRAIE
jgi:hypothetical protein